jgi:hypothetical protein
MLRDLKYYVIATALTALILVAVFDLRQCDLAVPLYDKVGGDALQSLVWVKTMHETGWVHQNPRLGAPGVLDMYDFPAPQLFNHLTIKALLAISGDPIMAHNLFFLLGFILSGWTSLFVLRHFGISGPIALAGGLLFAFLPAHFWRGTWHLSLAFYPAVPLGVLLCLWICADHPLFVGDDQAGGKRASLGRATAATAICALMSGSGIYYAWFMGFFLIVSGLTAWLRRPRLTPQFDAIICVMILLACIGLQTVPFAVHWRAHEPAPQALMRSPGTSQRYGLAVAELVLPTIGHRVPRWRVVESRRSINGGADPNEPTIGWRAVINERYGNALGVIGAAGFFFLCLAILAPEAGWLERLRPATDLARLNIAGVLLGSGFAILVEYFVPQIRCYNRIAIFIAFFSLFGSALVSERLKPRNPASPPASAFFLLALCVATVLGLLDEIPGVMTPDHRAQAAAYAEEAEYVRRVEALLEPNATVFELPYCEYPEPPHGYELFRPYLHSRRLRWSYDVSRGTKADSWQRGVAKNDLTRITEELCREGFTGLHVDLGLYEGASSLSRAEVDRELGPPDVTAKNGRWRFYRLRCPKTESG